MRRAKPFSAVVALIVAISVWASPLPLTRAETPAAREGTIGRLGIRDPMGWLESAGRYKDLLAKFDEALDRCDLERFRQAWEEAARLPPADFPQGVNPFIRFTVDAISARIRQEPAFRDRALDAEVGDGLFRAAVTYLALFYLWCDEFKVGRYVFNMNLARSRQQGGAGLRDQGGKPVHPKEAAGLLAEADAAVRRCAQATSAEGVKQAQASYQGAIDKARARAAALKQSATQARNAGDARAAEGYENDAAAFEALANDLERTRAERLKPCGPTGAEPSGAPGTVPGTTPGTTPDTPPGYGSIIPGTVPGRSDYQSRGLKFAVGGMFGNLNVPTFSAGTQFDPVLMREVPILVSPRNLSSAGGQVEFQAPVSSLFGSDVPSPFSQAAFYAQIRGYSFWGSESATVPVGGNNVAYNYLFANPATGMTQFLAGATGQRISIKTEGEAIQLNTGLKFEGPRLSTSPSITTMISLGVDYEYFDQGYKITQKSLTFADVSSFTKLRVDEHRIAPRLGFGVRADDGVFYAAASAHVAPGLLITDASARQRNRNPQDGTFRLEQSFSDTKFSVQTAFNLKLGARITQSLGIETSLNYEYASRAAFVRPPVTPPEQLSLGYGSRSKLFGGVFLTYRWNGPPR
jgi:hypothetical protein